MNYYHAIKALYPGILDSQFSLEADPKGVRLATWSYPAPKPELEDLEEEAIKQAKYHLVLRNRKLNYPSIVDQLDIMYHEGIEGWKATIKSVKDKYPKPE